MNKKPVYLTAAGYTTGIYALSYMDYFAVALGTSPFLVSIMVSVRNLGGNVLQLFWGALSDRRGRKMLLFYGFLVYAVTSVSFLFISSPLVLITVVVVQSLLGSMVIPVWNALLGDYSVRKSRGAFIGQISAVGTAAAIFAILIVGYVSDFIRDNLRQYIVPFSVAAFCFFLACVSSQKMAEPPRAAASEITIREAVFKDRTFKRFLKINGIFWGVMALSWPLFPFVTVKIVNATKFQMSAIWAVHMAVSVVSQRYGGRLSDTIGRRKSLVLFHFPMFMIAFMYAVASTWWFLVAASLFGGFSMGAGTVALNSYILDCASEEKRASYTAVNNLVVGLTSFCSSLAAGAVANYFIETVGLVVAIQTMLYATSAIRFGCAFLFLKTEEPL